MNRELGLSARPERYSLIGGADGASADWAPRTVSGQIDFLSTDVSMTTALDFQKAHGKQKPFVFVPDADDATTWARQCFLARNTDVPLLTGAGRRHDRFPFSFVEHRR
jgi:hypothetical protein